MSKHLLLCLMSVCLVLGITKGVRAFTFQTFDVPGAVNTEARGINNNGVIVGIFEGTDFN